jgi:hypothetical protein
VWHFNDSLSLSLSFYDTQTQTHAYFDFLFGVSGRHRESDVFNGKHFVEFYWRCHCGHKSFICQPAVRGKNLCEFD